MPIFFDEAGHRVATQYLMATLHGDLPAEQLLRYRQAHSHLPGHPELGLTPGVKFSSGRLGHIWPYINGVAIANPGKVVFCLGSDGSQQGGNDAEAARLAVAQHLNVKLIIDDNDVTIAGHPSKYLPGFSVAKTLEGHGLKVLQGDGEDLDNLYRRMSEAVNTPGAIALINKRPMCPGIEGLEGSTHGHNVISVDLAIKYLESRGQAAALEYLKRIEKPKQTYTFLGSSDKWGANRNVKDSNGNDFFGSGYKFVSGKDEVIREGTQGYIISFGDALYRALDAVERFKQEGLDVGLINKPTLNIIDEEMITKIGNAPFVLVVEAFNRRTGLGSRFGSWLLERGLTPKYAHLGTHKEGCGGLWEQYPYQGIDPVSIINKVKELVRER